MKGRSYHLQSSDLSDDWANGSWTVDCVCGVNFDDGEERVNCDECGVWVHTRCSWYVKGDDIFVCDQCKSKNNRNDSVDTFQIHVFLVLVMLLNSYCFFFFFFFPLVKFFILLASLLAKRVIVLIVPAVYNKPWLKSFLGGLKIGLLSDGLLPLLFIN
ncbi:Zinc finger, PHD-type, conserved site [Parasponia andersonii]|uniref:Zinc finger, PHD-type, conserved site n=1 Tax=Parasponia andersonii TaxID=3476 RepID=A0A2P5C779_PARAD|nr:Zinc finger, PHD-type, conserved site [Parasponia andersonii]